MTKDYVRYWLRIFTANLLMAIAIVLVFSDVGRVRNWDQWRDVARAVGTSFLFAMCIGPLVGLAMPRIAPWVWRRVGFPFNWIAVASAMVGFAFLGSAIAISLLILIGYIPAAEFGRWYFGSMRVSVAVTLTVGLFITAFEMNKARLAQASAEAQLASLESRVQPHFLFNTLNSIAALVHDDPSRAEKMTTDLAALLRSSLDQQSTPLVSLADELRIVRTYLDIERVRFGDRLRYQIDADDSIGGAQVPRLSVQTLVENGVKYAVSPRLEGASIVVRATASGGRVRVAVQDDGPGFDSASIPEGHGLALLRSRLSILFADRATLTIDGTAGRTVVAMDVPS